MGSDDDRPIKGVTWLGPVSGGEKRSMLASSRIYVAPNLGGESFGIVVAEAMAAGCAVIASDLEAFVDVSGGAAIHVPPGDAMALAQQVIAVLNDDVLAGSMSDAALRRVAQFDWSEVVDTYLDLYELELS
jgi:phosphatidylinositol alpha-mannosyltransferase